MNQNLMTIDEASLYTRLSPGALAQRRYAGQPPLYFKLGKSVVYSKDRIDEWLIASERSGTADTREGV